MPAVSGIRRTTGAALIVGGLLVTSLQPAGAELTRSSQPKSSEAEALTGLRLAAAGGPVRHHGMAAESSRRAGCRAGRIALTFDDGPAPNLTPRLLKILKARNTPAVFFVVGRRVAAARAATRMIERRGFLLANHSYDHTDMRTQSRAQVVSALRRTDQAIRAAGGHPLRVMRPPYGAINSTVLAAARSTGHPVVLWNVDPRDWENRSSGDISASVLRQLRRGDNIVLLHDGVGNSPRSVDAVPSIIRGARSRGYCFVALDERGRPGYPTPKARIVVPPARRQVKEGKHIVATVRLSAPAGRATAVRLTLESRGADLKRDLGSFAKVVRVPAGSLQAKVRIPVKRDGLDEPTERLRLGLERGVGVKATAPTVPIALKDRDREPAILGEAASVAEPTAGTTTVPVKLRLSEVSAREVTVQVTTVPGTADESDYQPVTTKLTIPAGTRLAVVEVTINADLEFEDAETFLVRITSASRARVKNPDTEVTITPPASRRRANR